MMETTFSQKTKEIFVNIDIDIEKASTFPISKFQYSLCGSEDIYKLFHMDCDISVYLHIYPNIVLWFPRLMFWFIYLSITYIFPMTHVIREETDGKLYLMFELQFPIQGICKMTNKRVLLKCGVIQSVMLRKYFLS